MIPAFMKEVRGHLEIRKQVAYKIDIELNKIEITALVYIE
jgi:hypothetical protein